MTVSLFDLHCDTAFRMLTERQPLERNDFAVSLEKANGFERYIQVMALWIDHRRKDSDGWRFFWQMLKNLKSDPSLLEKKVHLTSSCPAPNEHRSLLLSLEDARILEGDLSRLDQLCEAGIRILTPLWAGVTCIGGAHNTQEGLTAFGKQAIARAISLGMIPDVSHASVRSTEEIFSVAEELHSPVIASHSNAYAVCPVSRNLRDGQIREVLRLGGLIGLNFYTGFLKEDRSATAASVFEHIDYFLSRGAEHALALGGDMDGCDLPKDLPDLSALPALAEQMLSHNYSEQLVRAIFFENAYAFAQKHLQ